MLCAKAPISPAGVSRLATMMGRAVEYIQPVKSSHECMGIILPAAALSLNYKLLEARVHSHSRAVGFLIEH